MTAVNKSRFESTIVNRSEEPAAVNTFDTYDHSVNRRLSLLQRAILQALAAAPGNRHCAAGELPIHRLRVVFGLEAHGWGMSASQRASLSRSLRRLQAHGLIHRPSSPYGVAITDPGRHAVNSFEDSPCC